MMRERPILFSCAMIRALLAGTKTQTRRIVKSQPSSGFAYIPTTVCENMTSWGARSPYGQIGNHLWVRETFADLTETHGQPLERRDPSTGLYVRCKKSFIWYRADGDQPGMGDDDCSVSAQPWRPSIFMPRWASRITLEVTDVRVQRLQEISAEDCISEGLKTTLREHDAVCALRDGYRDLWDSINAKRSPWSANAWVWAITFQRLP